MSDQTPGGGTVLVEQLYDRLGRLEDKIDQVVELKPRVDVNDREIRDLKEEQAAQAEAIQGLKEENAATKATNGLLKTLFIVLVAPLVVALAIGGMAALFGIDL